MYGHYSWMIIHIVRTYQYVTAAFEFIISCIACSDGFKVQGRTMCAVINTATVGTASGGPPVLLKVRFYISAPRTSTLHSQIWTEGRGDVGIAPCIQLPANCRSGPPKAVPTHIFSICFFSFFLLVPPTAGGGQLVSSPEAIH